MQKNRPNCKNICFSPPLCILHEIYSNMPGKILFMEPITLLSGKFFQNKREHIDRFIDQLLHMVDIFLRKRYGLNTFLEYFLQKADMDLCVLTLDDLISIGMILAFDAIRKSISQFNRDISAARMHPITGRPSLKTSLPGHSVKYRFFDLSAILSKHFSVCIFHKIYCRSPCKIHFFPCMAKSLFPPEAII